MKLNLNAVIRLRGGFDFYGSDDKLLEFNRADNRFVVFRSGGRFVFVNRTVAFELDGAVCAVLCFFCS